MPNALRFRQWKTPKQAGERARLKVVHGPDSGSLFVVTSTKFSIGRGDENDVVIGDLRASRRHAELVRMPNGTWKLTDLGSQNGVVWNGKITREAELRAGDVVTVGETAFEFVPEESGTQLMTAAPKAISPEHLAGRPSLSALPAVAAPVSTPSVSAMAAFGGASGIAGLQMPAAGDHAALQGITGLGSAGADGGAADKRKKTIRIVLGLVVAGLLLYDPPKDTSPKDAKAVEAAKVKAKKDKEAERELASFLPPLPASGPMMAAETFFKEGFREFQQENYLRARVQFQTALQINPGHSLAQDYLKQSKAAIEDQVKAHLDRGRQDFDSGKLKSARGHFEAVLRLLYQESPENPSVVEAREQLKAVLSRLGPGGADS
jgi:hypothetical protein